MGTESGAEPICRLDAERPTPSAARGGDPISAIKASTDQPIKIGQRVRRAGLDGEWLVEAIRLSTRTAFLRGPYETGKELSVEQVSLDGLTPITDLETPELVYRATT